MLDKEREFSYGEKAVGLTFNPSNDSNVQELKEAFASIIDKLDFGRGQTDDPEHRRLLSIAITEAQSAQMWAVKAATWGYNK